jgi:hypothetical protein
MPITCFFDHDLRTMVAIANGTIAWEEVRSHLLVERLEGGLSYSELIDARVATPAWSSDHAREIVELLTTFSRKSAPLGCCACLRSCSATYVLSSRFVTTRLPSNGSGSSMRAEVMTIVEPKSY